VKGLVLPYLEKLKKSRISKRDMSFVNILESNLTNIISSFTHRLSSRHLNLTPKELQVANLVKEGRTTKEIAEMMGICAGAVSLHRNHVRNKLGINSKKINLQSYLSSLP
jgi:DNA-binding NarL/FixJ family response regulator